MTLLKDIKFNFLNADEQERYQKHLTLKEIGKEGQLKLKNCSVLCIGAGGLGSSVLIYLAAVGIGKVGIVGFMTTINNVVMIRHQRVCFTILATMFERDTVLKSPLTR